MPREDQCRAEEHHVPFFGSNLPISKLLLFYGTVSDMVVILLFTFQQVNILS